MTKICQKNAECYCQYSIVTFRILDGVNQDSGNGRDIGNCPNPTNYPTADATMNPDPGIYNALTVPNNLKCLFLQAQKSRKVCD